MSTTVAAKPKTKPQRVPKPVAARRARAAAEKLSKADQEFLDDVLLPRARGPFDWLGRQILVLRRRLSRTEFDTVCEKIREYLDGQAMEPRDVPKRAKRLFEAYTDVACVTGCTVCQETWIATLVVQVRGWTGTMFYSRSFQLRDPDQRGAK